MSHVRQAGLLTGHVLCCAWDGDVEETRLCTARLNEALDRIASLPLPTMLHVRVSEGYAYYALYPQIYIEAARQFFREAKPREVVCIGIRSIGTSLSAVVAATLEEFGCRVHAYTVRCQGHPFDRRLVLDARLEQRFGRMADRHFLIVDESPGLNGSSFCGVERKLIDLGVAEGRIVLLPSHNTDGSGFVSESARRRWPRHKKYTVEFEDIWIRSGRLARSLPSGQSQDLSGGQWRGLLYADESQYPVGQIDGRMLLHEWLRTATGYLKTDSVDHADDHFSPGCRDIAWDIAAAITEWNLNAPLQNHLLDRYTSLASDRTIRARLPFYTIAYLAHRLGYATMAAQTLGPDHPDGRRFQCLIPRHASRLRQEISRL